MSQVADDRGWRFRSPARRRRELQTAALLADLLPQLAHEPELTTEEILDALFPRRRGE